MLCFFSIYSSNKIYSLKLYKLIAISLPMHECFTISCVMLYHLLNSTLHSKANACYRHFFLDFITRAYGKKKHLPIDSISYSHNSVAILVTELPRTKVQHFFSQVGILRIKMILIRNWVTTHLCVLSGKLVRSGST